MSEPTYPASEVIHICQTYELEDCRLLMDVIYDEVDRYPEADLVILMQAAMVMMTRSMIKISCDRSMN